MRSDFDDFIAKVVEDGQLGNAWQLLYPKHLPVSPLKSSQSVSLLNDRLGGVKKEQNNQGARILPQA